MQGIPLRVVDTAGLRSTDDPIESLGVQRTRAQIVVADLVVWVLDGSEGITATDRALAARIEVPQARLPLSPPTATFASTRGA